MTFSCIFEDPMTGLLHITKYKIFFHREDIHRMLLISDDVCDLPSNYHSFLSVSVWGKNPLSKTTID